MKLGSISNNSRDGCPVLVDHCLRYMVPVKDVIDNWQRAIENWSAVSPKLEKIYEKLDKGLAEIIVAKHRNGPTGSADIAFFESFATFDNLDFTHQDINIPS